MGGLSFEMERKFEEWGVESVLKNRAYKAYRSLVRGNFLVGEVREL